MSDARWTVPVDGLSHALKRAHPWRMPHAGAATVAMVCGVHKTMWPDWMRIKRGIQGGLPENYLLDECPDSAVRCPACTSVVAGIKRTNHLIVCHGAPAWPASECGRASGWVPVVGQERAARDMFRRDGWTFDGEEWRCPHGHGDQWRHRGHARIAADGTARIAEETG